MPAIVNPRKTSSDSSRRGPVKTDALLASVVLGSIVVSVEVAIALPAQLSLYTDYQRPASAKSVDVQKLKVGHRNLVFG
jgi:hypothetical protein